ncbi:hypothetical protein NESM_000052200 [Novymonas esmeraldas]|uniref:Uncharacterized protein n=1 Tax=Novymonas esmeraldas TaxID=1808958 RepID=A0AAW0F4F1_9TRYP
MEGTAYIVRCQHCGVARKSYNDPRRGISVIECKRPCGNSHYDWTFVDTIALSDTWPPANAAEGDVPVYVRPTPPPLLLSTPTSSRTASPSPTNPRTGSPAALKAPLQFSSKGRGSLARSPPATTTRRRPSPSPASPSPLSCGQLEGGERGAVLAGAMTTAVPTKKEKCTKTKGKRDCVVQ